MVRSQLIARIPPISAWIVLAIYQVTVLGWHFRNHLMVAWSGDVATMKVNVAAAAALCAISLLTLHSRARARLVSPICAITAGCIALVTLAEYAFGWQAGIDEVFWRDTNPGPGLAPGRMAVATAINFVLIGVALLLARNRARGWVAQVVLLPAVLFTILSLAGYFYGSTEVNRLAPFGAMALNTTIMFMALLTGVLFSMPDFGIVAAITRGGLSGSFARRLIPVAILVPLIAGWLRLQGQRLDLYGTEFGLAIFTTTTIVVLVLFIIGSVNFLSGLESAKQKTDLDLQIQRDALKEQAELIDLSNDAIILADAGRRITGWNGGAEKLYGWEEREALGEVTHELLKTSSTVPVAEIDEMLRRRNRWEGELIHTCRDGRLITVDSRHILQQGADGSPRGFLEINRDVTDRKQLEEQLFQSQKLESLGRLAGGVAHDFNNLLTVINGYCELLLTDTRIDEAIQEDLRQIRSAGEQGGKLTRQLLAFSRKQMLKSVALNLNQILSDTTRMLRRLIGTQITLAVELAPDLSNIRADAGQIQQIFLNLAVNSRDAMPAGGTLRIETADVHLNDPRTARLPKLQPGRYVLLTIADDGMGMTPEVQERIFEPFFTTKARERGTGLGLATVYGIVKQMGGHIRVVSEVGRGTTFYIYFPRTEEALVPVEVSSHNNLHGTEIILVVEDQENVRTLVVTALVNFGYTVHSRQNGAEALAFCESHTGSLDLLLTDVIMPGIDGTQLAERVRGVRPGIRILLMSGYPDNAMAPGAPLEGAAYLPKPFTPESLGVKVRELLGSPSARQVILLVDDDAPVRRAVRRFLVGAGYSVLEAANGRQALETFHSAPRVDVVITDMVMDVEDGEDLIRHLRKTHPDLRVIAMSGMFRNTSADPAAALRVQATIGKPFTRDEFLKTVRRVLADS